MKSCLVHSQHDMTVWCSTNKVLKSVVQLTTFGPQLIGERERANLVVQLARFFYISLYGRCHSKRAHNFAILLRTFPFCCGSPMDAECPAANVQPTFHDGATPSGSSRCARESTEARDKRLARDRARRRERLASETAEEKERRLSQRRRPYAGQSAACRPLFPCQ